MNRVTAVGFVLSFLGALPPTSAKADLASRLAEALSPLVRATDRSFYTYHYVTMRKLGISSIQEFNIDDPRVQNHLQYLAGLAFDPQSAVPGGLAPAFYVGVDPIASRSYGGTDWVLYQVEVPRGFRYMDWRGEEAVPEALGQELAEAGCRMEVNGTTVSATSYAMLIMGSFGLACRQVVVRAMQSLRIEAFRYKFGVASGLVDCLGSENESSDRSAFALMGPQSIDQSRGRIFWRNSPDTEGAVALEKRYIEQLFLESLRGQTDANPEQSRLWPELDGHVPPGYAEWKREHLVNCAF